MNEKKKLLYLTSLTATVLHINGKEALLVQKKGNSIIHHKILGIQSFGSEVA